MFEAVLTPEEDLSRRVRKTNSDSESQMFRTDKWSFLNAEVPKSLNSAMAEALVLPRKVRLGSYSAPIVHRSQPLILIDGHGQGYRRRWFRWKDVSLQLNFHRINEKWKTMVAGTDLDTIDRMTACVNTVGDEPWPNASFVGRFTTRYPN